MVQGALGDGYFVGAVNSIAWGRGQSLKPLERLFVYDNAKWGVYGVLFFKEGAWEWVRVPVRPTILLAVSEPPCLKEGAAGRVQT